jgi:alkylation response protein AidB-like acyl-CoA dehydrogenase
MRVLDHSRPGIAAQALGIAEGALDLARRYARERKQFGQPIGAFQGIQFMLADMATLVEAARMLTYAAGDALDRRQPDISITSSMAKLLASDTAMRVTTDTVQILGGYGYLRDFPAERMMRDAKITQIYEGTNEIQRLVIARALLKQS